MVNWDVGKHICQDMLLSKKLTDMTGYFDRGSVPGASALSASSSGSQSGHFPFNRSESTESVGTNPRNLEPASSQDMIREAKNNFQNFLNAKFGKQAPQVQYFAESRPPKIERQWYYWWKIQIANFQFFVQIIVCIITEIKIDIE